MVRAVEAALELYRSCYFPFFRGSLAVPRALSAAAYSLATFTGIQTLAANFGL